MTGWRVRLWVLWQTSRPDQLLLILVVYLLGAKIAAAVGTSLDGRHVALGALPLLTIAASVHYANEYADYETDARTKRTPFSGGSGALQRANLPRSLALHAAVASLCLGMLLVTVLAATGWLTLSPVALLGIIAVFGWQYSLPPLQLAWRGWGEVDNSLLGGLVLPVYGAAVIEGPLATVALAVLPFFLVVLLNLFATQWPDRAADASVGKDTLAVQWSPTRLRRSYAVIGCLAGASLLALWGSVLPTAVVLASLPVAPLVVWGALRYTNRVTPWPTVLAMVGLAVLQFASWCWVAA